MSQLDNTMSMNSLMDCIYGINPTQTYETLEQFNDAYQGVEQIPDFMESLTNHLVQLSMTQSATENVHSKLKPWIREYCSSKNRYPKESLQNFLQDFLILLEQQTQKIQKFRTKKLQYLTKTVHKQIFTQIMRVSCDLKLENINRTNNQKSFLKRKTNVTLLVSVINRFALKNMAACLRHMKVEHRNSIQKEDQFIGNLQMAFKKVNRYYKKKIKTAKSKVLQMWRRKSIIMNLYESQNITNAINIFQEKLLPDVIRAWETSPGQWISFCVEHIEQLLLYCFPNLKGVEINFYVDKKISELKKAEGLSYSESNFNSYRSYLSRKSLKSSVFSYLGQQQIKYDEDNNSAFIPIHAGKPLGMIIVTWDQILPITLFQKVLRVFEMTKQIIEHIYQLGSRLSYHFSQFQMSQWQIEAFKRYTDQPLLRFQDNFEQSKRIINSMGIAYLQIYHKPNQMQPCLIVGEQQLVPFQKQIYDLIWEKLQSTKYFTLQRDQRKFEICQITYGGHGFCRFIAADQELKDPQMMVESIVPMLLKMNSKPDCEVCSIDAKQEIESERYKERLLEELKQKKVQLQIEQIIKFQKVKCIQEVQILTSSYLRQSFTQEKLFVKFFYCIEEQTCEYATMMDKGNSIQIIKLPKTVTLGHAQDYSLFEKQAQLDEWRNLVKILQSHPLVDSPDIPLYIYEKQKSNTFRLLPFKLNRRVLILLGSYQTKALKSKSQTILEKWMENYISVVKPNQNLFSKMDAWKWAQQTLNQSTFFELPHSSILQEIQNQCKSVSDPLISIQKVISLFLKSINPIQQTFSWKIRKNLSSGEQQIIDKPESVLSQKFQFPNNVLLTEPLLSHQKIAGAHMFLRKSINSGFKLRENLTYIPSIGDKNIQIKYAEALFNRILSSGELTDSAGNEISEFLRKNINFNKSVHNFMSIPIQLPSHSNYQITALFVFCFSKSITINHKNFESLTNFLQQNCLQAIRLSDELRKEKMKSALISELVPQFRKTQGIKKSRIVKKFVQNYRTAKAKLQKLGQSVNKTIFSCQFRFSKICFQLIKQNFLMRKEEGKKNALFLWKKINKIFLFNQLVKISKEYSKNNKFGKLIQKIICKKLKQRNQQILDTLKSINTNFKKNKTTRVLAGVRRMDECIRKIEKKRKIALFQINFREKEMMKRDFQLIREQFIIMNFRGTSQCFKFLNSRLNVVLSQYYCNPIMIQILNKDRSSQDLQIIVEDLIPTDFLTITNSRFIIKINKDAQNIVQENGYDRLSSPKKLIKEFLASIIPQWEKNINIPYLTFATKILSSTVSKLLHNRLKQLFIADKREKIRSNQFALNKMRGEVSGVKEDVQKLLQEQIKTKSLTSTKARNGHIQKMKGFESQLDSLVNEGRKLGVEHKIKQKTNSVYIIQEILQKQKFKNLGVVREEIGKQNIESGNFMKETEEQIETILESTGCIKRIHHLKVLPVWIQTMKGIGRRIEGNIVKQSAKLCLQELINK